MKYKKFLEIIFVIWKVCKIPNFDICKIFCSLAKKFLSMKYNIIIFLNVNILFAVWDK